MTTGTKKWNFAEWWSEFDGLYWDLCLSLGLKYDSLYTIWSGVNPDLLEDPERCARTWFFNHFDEEIAAVEGILGINLTSEDEVYTGPTKQTWIFNTLFGTR